MNDTTEFFLFLAGLYLVECVVRAPRHAVAFRATFSPHWRIVKGSDLYGNDRWGFLLSHPLPDLGPTLLSELYPVSLSAEAVCSRPAEAFNPGSAWTGEARCVRYEQMTRVEASGRELRINGERFVITATANMAAALARLLSELSGLPPGRRGERIEAFLRAGADPAPIEARIREYESLTSGAALAGNALFVHLFAISPFVAWRYGLELTWWMLLAGLAVLLLAVMGLYHRAHRRLYPGQPGDRWSHLAAMTLFPLAAMRAPAALARHLVAGYHPLAVAKVIAAPETFARLAGEMLRDLACPHAEEPPGIDSDAARNERAFRQILRPVLGDLVASAGLDPDAMTARPVPEGEDCHTYCPRCHCQFIIADGRCEPCGQRLLPLR